MINYLSQMYGKQSEKTTRTPNDKNPNRVAGGLRAQGADMLEMLGEDGSVQKIPTEAYVRSLEDQSRKQRAAITVLERKLTRCETAIDQLKSVISRS